MHLTIDDEVELEWQEINLAMIERHLQFLKSVVHKLEEKGNWKKAMQLCDQILDCSPKDTWAWAQKGRLFIEHGGYLEGDVDTEL